MFSSWKLQSDCCLIFTEGCESLRPVSSTTTPQQQAHNKPSLSVLPGTSSPVGLRQVVAPRQTHHVSDHQRRLRGRPSFPFEMGDFVGGLLHNALSQKHKLLSIEMTKFSSVSSKKNFSTSRNFEKNKKQNFSYTQMKI